MWNLKSDISNTCVYKGKRFNTLGIKSYTKNIVFQGKAVLSAYVTPNTKKAPNTLFLFKEFEEDGELFYEKCVYGFLPELFQKWKKIGCNHVVSIVLFGRVLYNELVTDYTSPVDQIPSSQHYYNTNANFEPKSFGSTTGSDYKIHRYNHQLSRDSIGRLYRDFYKVVADWEVESDWNSVLIPLRKQFIRFKKDILQLRSDDDANNLSGDISMASEGNILEAINLAMNPFDKHYVDRDLSRTGLSIIIISVGTGLFEVEKKLCRLTTQRMIDNGIAVDFVSLSKPPLYTVPLFQFVSRDYYSVKENMFQRNSSAPNSFEKEPYLGKGQSLITASLERKGQFLGTKSSSGLLEKNAPLSFEESDPEIITDPLYHDDDTINNPDRLYFFEPPWLEISFWNRGKYDENQMTKVGKGREIPQNKKFSNRCKMYEVQTLGVMEQVGSTIILPYFDYFERNSTFQKNGKAIFENPTLQPLNQYPLYNGSILPPKDQPVNSETVKKAKSNIQFSPSNIDYDQYEQALFHNATVEPCAPLKARQMSDLSAIFGQKNTDTMRSIDPELVRNTRQYLVSNPKNEDFGSPPHQLSTSFGKSKQRENLSILENAFIKPNFSSPSLGALLNKPENDKRKFSSRFGVSNDDGDLHSTPVKFQSTNPSPTIAPIHIKSPNNHGQSYLLSRSFVRDNEGVIGTQQQHVLRGTGNSYSESFRTSPTTERLYSGLKASPSRNFYSAINTGKFTQRSLNHLNPSNPSKNYIHANFQSRRWHHVDISASKFDLVNWKSLCTPACLPLTTDFFPNEELLRSYQEYTYTISPTDDATFYQDRTVPNEKKVQSLLIELISQRLAQGFQLTYRNMLLETNPLISLKQPSTSSLTGVTVGLSSGVVAGVGSVVVGRETSTTEELKFKKMDDLIQSEQSPTQLYYLSLGDHVHQLGVDQSGENVKVKRYVRKVGYNTDPISYTCAIWPKNIDFYSPKTFNFAYTAVGSYNWNYLDQLISGYQDEMTDNLRYWRMRFLLIPMERMPLTNALLNPSNANLDEEELRLSGFLKFIELYEKAKWVAETVQTDSSKQQYNKKLTKHYSTLEIALTTFNPSAYVWDEVNKMAANLDSLNVVERRSSNSFPTSVLENYTQQSFSRSLGLVAIAQAMQKQGGVVMCDRRWHFNVYEHSFVGSEFLDWICLNFVDVESREDAIEFGNELMSKGLFVHMNQRLNLQDGYYFYQLNKEYIIVKERQEKEKFTWLKSAFGGNKSSSLDAQLLESSTNLPHVGSSDMQIPSFNQLNLKPGLDLMVEPIELVRKIVLDMDPQKKSSCREMAVLHYDTIHNPKNCFHFQVHWLVGTAKLIQDMLSNWSRVADKCGLRLVEAPLEQAEPLGETNPFQSVIPIKLCLPPPSRSAFPTDIDPLFKVQPFWFESELVMHHGFILDVESDDLFPQNHTEYSCKKSPYKYTQFVHRSGVAFLQVLPFGKGFLWVDNRLLLTSSNASGISKSNVGYSSTAHLRSKFEAFCNDLDGLKSFWESCMLKLPVKSKSID